MGCSRLVPVVCLLVAAGLGMWAVRRCLFHLGFAEALAHHAECRTAAPMLAGWQTARPPTSSATCGCRCAAASAKAAGRSAAERAPDSGSARQHAGVVLQVVVDQAGDEVDDVAVAGLPAQRARLARGGGRTTAGLAELAPAGCPTGFPRDIHCTRSGFQ